MCVTLRKSDELLPLVERTLRDLYARIRALVPDADLHHVGATALPGALTKGNIDILLRVSGPRFGGVVDVLRRHFQIKQPANWTAEFASFGDDGAYDLPVGVQVVVEDTSTDFLLFFRDYFLGQPQAIAEYNRVKAASCEGSAEDYWKAKDEFLGRILASRKR